MSSLTSRDMTLSRRQESGSSVRHLIVQGMARHHGTFSQIFWLQANSPYAIQFSAAGGTVASSF